MRIGKILLLLFFLSQYSLRTSAQNVDQIYMKSGSILEGYIAEQVPGKYITIQATTATIVVNNDSLQNQIIEKVPLESLSSEWKNWAEKNEKYTNNEGQKQLSLSTLVFKNRTYSNVYILEKGSLIKFIDLTPNKYKFFWGDMYRSVKKQRSKNQFSGIKEILELKDKSKVEGQIIEQFPGKDLKILTTAGDILSYKYNQVEKIQSLKFNKDMDLWSQVFFFDRLKVEGENSLLEGFISARTLSKDLTMILKNGQQRTIPLHNILKYEKIPNPGFVSVCDKYLDDGVVLLNGKTAYFDKLQKNGQYLLLGEMVSAQVVKGDTINIEGHFSNPNVQIALIKAQIKKFVRNNNGKEEHITCPSISYQDIVQSSLSFTREVTPLKNTKISFVVNEIGDYVVYIQGKEGYIVINVIE